MLADGEDIQPDLLGLLRDPDDRVDPLRLARRLPRHRVAGDVTDREHPELHDPSPHTPCVCIDSNRYRPGGIPVWRGSPIDPGQTAAPGRFPPQYAPRIGGPADAAQEGTPADDLVSG